MKTKKKKDATDVVVKKVESEYKKFANRSNVLQVYHLWSKYDVHRVRVNIRDSDSWKIKESWFLKVDASDVSNLTIIDETIAPKENTNYGW